ncbi:unnamed protein product [Nesidiocoris tenuis]|uniref:Uncharacterized protein n=1 Tax=Nesidiocoris tenuis TaxID=355587 RepID=A0A6H5HDL5_9HEMI|nr:unnamed protein product [Nesidiocoris tenuis]
MKLLPEPEAEYDYPVRPRDTPPSSGRLTFTSELCPHPRGSCPAPPTRFPFPSAPYRYLPPPPYHLPLPGCCRVSQLSLPRSVDVANMVKISLIRLRQQHQTLADKRIASAHRWDSASTAGHVRDFWQADNCSKLGDPLNTPPSYTHHDYFRPVSTTVIPSSDIVALFLEEGRWRFHYSSKRYSRSDVEKMSMLTNRFGVLVQHLGRVLPGQTKIFFYCSDPILDFRTIPIVFASLGFCFIVSLTSSLTVSLSFCCLVTLTSSLTMSLSLSFTVRLTSSLVTSSSLCFIMSLTSSLTMSLSFSFTARLTSNLTTSLSFCPIRDSDEISLFLSLKILTLIIRGPCKARNSSIRLNLSSGSAIRRREIANLTFRGTRRAIVASRCPEADTTARFTNIHAPPTILGKILFTTANVQQYKTI